MSKGWMWSMRLQWILVVVVFANACFKESSPAPAKSAPPRSKPVEPFWEKVEPANPSAVPAEPFWEKVEPADPSAVPAEPSWQEVEPAESTLQLSAILAFTEIGQTLCTRFRECYPNTTQRYSECLHLVVSGLCDRLGCNEGVRLELLDSPEWRQCMDRIRTQTCDRIDQIHCTNISRW